MEVATDGGGSEEVPDVVAAGQMRLHRLLPDADSEIRVHRNDAAFCLFPVKDHFVVRQVLAQDGIRLVHEQRAVIGNNVLIQRFFCLDDVLL